MIQQLSLANIVNISVAETPTGVGNYNTSNLALICQEQPLTPFDDGYKIYLSATDVASDFTTGSHVATLASTIFSQTPNILQGGGYLVIIPELTSPSVESLEAAITRTQSLVQYFGIITDEIVTDNTVTDAAVVVQALNKILFVGKKLEADVAPTTGIASVIKDSGYDKTRVLLYMQDDDSDDTAATKMAAAYASRALSTNFTGSNTTQTMHMKDLVGITADGDLTQTILTKAITAGADTYGNYAGVPKVYSTGANEFFDDVYNRCWFVGALEVAGFNYLAQTSSKIPQSEAGVGGLKGAYRKVLEQAITNQYLAPGSWTSPDTFGVLEDFHRNIQDRGYYIYSLPVSLQSSADREDRKAPLIQIAAKSAGAIHSSNVIVYINK